VSGEGGSAPLPDVPGAAQARLERTSSSAKRQADNSWTESQSPHKRQETDQTFEHDAPVPDPQPTGASRDTAATHASGSAACGATTMTDAGGSSAASAAGTQPGDAQHPGADSHTGDGFGSGLASYIPGTEANRASHAQQDQAPDQHTDSSTASRIASYIPGSTTAGRLASYIPGSATAGRLAGFTSGTQGNAASNDWGHHWEQADAQESQSGDGVSGGLASYTPDSEANRAGQADQTQGPESNDTGHGIASYVPGTEANRASHAEDDQAPDSSGNSGGLTSYIPGKGTNRASRGLSPQSGTANGIGSSLASYVPGTEANRESLADKGQDPAVGPTPQASGQPLAD